MECSDVKSFWRDNTKIDKFSLMLQMHFLLGVHSQPALHLLVGCSPHWAIEPIINFHKTPPATFESFAVSELHYIFRLFWVFNTLSFFFAIATVISRAKVVFLDLDAIFIVEALHSMHKDLQFTTTLLVCFVVIILGSFVCVGFVVLPLIHRDTKNMNFFVAIGLIVCSWIIFKFLVKLKKKMVKIMVSSQNFRFFPKLKEIMVKIVSKSKTEHLKHKSLLMM